MATHTDSHVMLQVFAHFSRTPDVPVLLRVPTATSNVGSLVTSTLLKLAESKLCGTLPHLYLDGYIVYPALGDGKVNRKAGPVPLKDLLRDSSVLTTFPYMVALVACPRDLPGEQQDEPLPIQVLAAFGLPESAAPRPLPPNVRQMRAQYMRYAGLTEAEVNRFGPRGDLEQSSSQQAKVQQAMILRRREDTLAKKAKQHAIVEAETLAHSVARDAALQANKREEALQKAKLSALEKEDPLYGARQKLENDVTRLRHKLESDLSRGHAMSGQLSPSSMRRAKAPSSKKDSPQGEVKSAPPTASVPTRSRAQTMQNIVAALDTAVLQEYVAQQEAFKRERELRAKRALTRHEQMVKPPPLASKDVAPPRGREFVEKNLKSVALVKPPVDTDGKKFEEWKKARAQSFGPDYARAELKTLQK